MIVALLIIAGLVLLLLWLIFPAPRRHRDRALLKNLRIAHRGLHNNGAGIPENSLAAFRRAVKYGFAIENDIHLTADGEVVVFHDDTLERMCGVPGRVEEMTLAELKALHLGDTGETIPTLRECLETVAGRVPLLIEFKCVGLKAAPLCKAADRILSEYTGKYFVQSFYPAVLLWYRRHCKKVCRGQLASGFRGEALYKRLLGCLIFNVFARPDFVSYEHTYASHPMRRLVTWLGAFPVGWTFQNQQELDLVKKEFHTYIFEWFIPESSGKTSPISGKD